MPEGQIKLADRKHPLYEDNIGKWDFYFDSSTGGDNILNGQYIETHRLEDAQDHTQRVDRAYFLNFCDAIPSIYNSYIFKERIERPPNEAIKYFRNNVDGRGTSISDFVKRAGYFASIYGVIHAIIDMPQIPKNKSVSQRDVSKGGISPYASLIFPTQLVDWSVDHLGNWRWVVLEYTYYFDSDPNVEREEKTLYKIITTEEWRIEDEDGAEPDFGEEGIESSGPNEFGEIPIITMYHKNVNDDKIGESLIKDISYINKAILNWCSCIDEQIERQTFSQLVVPDDGSLAEQDEAGDDPLRKIGTSSYWTFPHDSGQPPQFISPDTANIEVIWNLVMDHIKEIYRIAGLIGGIGDLYASRSGRAAQVGFMGANSALSEKASNYEKFENDISKMAMRKLGKEPTEEAYEPVKYPSSFDIGALADEIDGLFKVMSGNFSETLNKTIQKNVARKATPLATQKVRANIEQEIESGTGIVDVSISEETKGKGEEGNPNMDSLSDTHRGVKDKEFDEKTKQKK